jgi:D-serine deaminase-like pyridoxal phosphate-dependent protein
VSTLKEAEQFFADDIKDIVYAVGIAPHRLPHALDLRRRGCELTIITDSVVSAQAIVDFGRASNEPFKVLIEVDTDDHRSGLRPDDDELINVARVLHDGGMRLTGVMTHAGSSYELDAVAPLQRLAEQERAGCLRAAQRIREAGMPCHEVSVGSTPTAIAATELSGVTEVRAGVYVFFDLVMHNVGVCTMDDLALSVLTTVIGHQNEKGWAIVDAGWMAMSRDRGTSKQKCDYGYGQVCTLEGRPLSGYCLTGANQEHGIVSRAGAKDPHIAQRFPIGSRMRIFPNHACATGAQFPEYQALAADGRVRQWARFHGW